MVRAYIRKTPEQSIHQTGHCLWNLEQPEIFNFAGLRFDVREAKKIICSNPRPTKRLEVTEKYVKGTIGSPPYKDEKGAIHMSMGVGIDWERVQKEDIDTSVPVIFAETKYGYLLIDGHHRLAKAWLNKEKYLTVVVLTREETKKIER